jgi:hypothetical protein
MRWLLAGLDLSGEPAAAWRHAGGTAVDGRTVEVLEYRPPERREEVWKVGFGGETWQWRLLQFAGPNGEAVRLIFGNHRTIDGLELPGHLKCTIDDELSFADSLGNYELVFETG